MSRHHARLPDRLPRMVVCRVKPIAPSVHALLTLVLGIALLSAAITGTAQIFGPKEPATAATLSVEVPTIVLLMVMGVRVISPRKRTRSPPPNGRSMTFEQD